MDQREPNRETAEEAYLASHLRSLELLEAIHGALHDSPAPDGETPITWSHVAERRHVEDQLRALHAWLTGQR